MSIISRLKIISQKIVASGGSASAIWGAITGTLSDQTDLQNALDAKVDDSQVVTDFTTINDSTIPTTKAVNDQIIKSVSGLTTYFFYKTPSTIIGANYTMTKTPSSGGVQTISGVAGVPSGTLLTTFMTNAGDPGITFLPSGLVRFHIHAVKTAGTKDTSLYAELYKSDSAGGTQVLLVTSGYSDLLTGVSSEVTVDTVLSSPVLLLDTDLLEVKWYTYSTGGGTNPTIDLTIENNTIARLELPFSTVELSGYQPLLDLHSGTVNIDFGKDGVLSENDLVITTVSASWVTSTTKIQCFVENDGVDHAGEDVYLENIIATVYNIVPNTSFDIIAVAHNLTWGRYKITYKEII